MRLDWLEPRDRIGANQAWRENNRAGEGSLLSGSRLLLRKRGDPGLGCLRRDSSGCEHTVNDANLRLSLSTGSGVYRGDGGSSAAENAGLKERKLLRELRSNNRRTAVAQRWAHHQDAMNCQHELFYTYTSGGRRILDIGFGSFQRRVCSDEDERLRVPARAVASGRASPTFMSVTANRGRP